MDKFKIFLSHATIEASIAIKMKEYIEQIFAHGVDVFVASHDWSLKPGDLWEEKIRHELRKSEMMLVLLSPDSITRPWINFEAGAAWSNKITLIPMMHRGLTARQLVRPFSSHQAIDLSNSEDLSNVMRRIAEKSGLSPVISDEQFANLVLEIANLGQLIDSDIAQKSLPERARSTVRYYLYNKSRAQYRQTVYETDGLPLSCFRKPDIFEVFEDVSNYQQPDTTVISLDEYWVKELAALDRLENLKSFTDSQHFLVDLQFSGTYNDNIWAVPHFLDFSYYLGNNEYWNIVEPLLLELSIADNAEMQIKHLQEVTGLNNLLIYDFHTPDTCACVILEFLDSFGDGIDSLLSESTIVAERNIMALKILKSMVGKRKDLDFLRGEPLDFDLEYKRVAFVRGWHSRMSNMPKTLVAYKPLISCPIMGTLGGWYVGILSNAPSIADGNLGLSKLINIENQQERLKLGAGLPTLSKFYETADLAMQTDPLTKWSLAEIKGYVKNLIRRSKISNYSWARGELCILHNKIMLNSEATIEENFVQWAKNFAKEYKKRK